MQNNPWDQAAKSLIWKCEYLSLRFSNSVYVENEGIRRGRATIRTNEKTEQERGVISYIILIYILLHMKKVIFLIQMISPIETINLSNLTLIKKVATPAMFFINSQNSSFFLRSALFPTFQKWLPAHG